MSKVLLGIIGNGRRELLAQTVASAESHLKGNFFEKVMINDAPSKKYNNYLIGNYRHKFRVINHDKNMGLSGSVQSLWIMAQMLRADYIFHLEEDFLFNEDIYINDLITILEGDFSLAQIALKRQPCNPAEIEVGGFMQQSPSSYTLEHIGRTWRFGTQRPPGNKTLNYLTHRNFFTLNPCLYPISTTRIGWEKGWGEKEFGERLFSNELIKCAYLGKIDDAPLVHHTGSYRGENWYV